MLGGFCDIDKWWETHAEATHMLLFFKCNRSNLSQSTTKNGSELSHKGKMSKYSLLIRNMCRCLYSLADFFHSEKIQ